MAFQRCEHKSYPQYLYSTSTQRVLTYAGQPHRSSDICTEAIDGLHPNTTENHVSTGRYNSDLKEILKLHNLLS